MEEEMFGFVSLQTEVDKKINAIKKNQKESVAQEAMGPWIESICLLCKRTRWWNKSLKSKP